MPDPEKLAREEIDSLLGPCGWVVQDKNAVNLAAARGVAVRELTFKTGEPDYTLFVDGKGDRDGRGQTRGPFPYRCRGAIGEIRQRRPFRYSRMAIASAFLLRVHRHRDSLYQSARSSTAQS